MTPILSFDKNPKQKEFVFNPFKYSAYVGGIRNGKTVGGCARSLMLSDLYPGNIGIVGRKTYKQLFDTTAKELFDLVKKRNGGTLEPGPYLIKYVASNSGIDAQTLIIRTKGEPSRIRLRFADDVNSFLGTELGFFYVDQLEDIDEDVYEHLESRLSLWNAQRREAFKNDYGYYPKHFGFATSNPHPGWVKQKLINNEKGLYKTYEAGTEANRANLPPGYLEELLASKPKDWVERFILGSWNISGGQVYKEFDEAVHVCAPFPIPSHWIRYVSLDWGFNHRTAILWTAVDENGDIWLYKELSVAGKLVSEIAEAIKEECKGDFVEKTEAGEPILWADPSTDRMGGIVNRTILDEFAAYGVILRKANNAVDAGIARVSEVLHVDPRRGKPRLKIFQGRCPLTIRGFKRYEWMPVGISEKRQDKPLKKDDDEMDSLRYNIMAILDDVSPAKAKRIDISPYDRSILNQMLSMGDDDESRQ